MSHGLLRRTQLLLGQQATNRDGFPYTFGSPKGLRLLRRKPAGPFGGRGRRSSVLNIVLIEPDGEPVADHGGPHLSASAAAAAVLPV